MLYRLHTNIYKSFVDDTDNIGVLVRFEGDLRGE